LTDYLHKNNVNISCDSIVNQFKEFPLHNALVSNVEHPYIRFDIFTDKTFHISLSLDGMDEKTHDYIRGKGAFATLTHNVKKMAKSDIYAAFTVTINTCNQDDMEKIADLAFNEFSARRVIFNFMRPIGRAQKNKNLYLSNIEMSKANERLKAIEEIYRGKVLISDDSELSEKVSSSVYDSSTRLACAAGTTIFSMDGNLDVYPCTYGVNSNLKMGNLYEENIIDIWQSQRWNLFRGGITLGQIDGCSSCQFTSQCKLKQCRLKPLSAGNDFYSHISYCHANK
jgi:radical SAM protein with 4Fe4S-binding SPASM domain